MEELFLLLAEKANDLIGDSFSMSEKVESLSANREPGANLAPESTSSEGQSRSLDHSLAMMVEFKKTLDDAEEYTGGADALDYKMDCLENSFEIHEQAIAWLKADLPTSPADFDALHELEIELNESKAKFNSLSNEVAEHTGGDASTPV